MTANMGDFAELKEAVAVIATNQEHLFESNRETNNAIRELSGSLTNFAQEVRANTESNRHLSNDVHKLDGRIAAAESRIHENELQVKSNTDFSAYAKWAARGVIGFAISVALLVVGAYLTRPDNAEGLQQIMTEQQETIRQLTDIANRLESQ